MQLGETTAALRRIPLVVYQDDGVTLATNADASPPAHALQVSVNGAAFGDAGGTFFGDASGLYWYEATLTEASTQGFLAFKYAAAGFKTTIVWQNVGDIFAAGETTASHLRWPIVIYQDDGVTLGTGAAAALPAHALQVSVNGAAFGDAAGSLVEVSSGLYYYQGVSGDAAAAASLGIKFVRSGFQTEITWVAVAPPAATADTSPPVITAVSPTPGTPAGSVGGMSSSFSTAARTPIVITVTDADGASDLELVQASVLITDGTAEVAYRAGVFTAGYVAGSSQVTGAGGVTLSLMRAAGWLAAPLATSVVIDAVDAGGNVVGTTFSYPMPAFSAVPAAPTAIADGAIDLLAETRRRVVWQLRA